MPKYLRLVNAVVTYPYNDALLRRDNPDVSFPSDMNDVLRAEYGVHPVQEVAPPTPADGRTSYVEGAPALVDGVWRQTWQAVVAPLSDWRATLECDSYAFRRALRQCGLRDAAETWLASAAEEHRDYFLHSRRIRRGHAAVEALRAALGGTHPQVDNVFVDARAID